jgi:Cu2+-exporting ATPase/Cu+-exporting ATPase
MVGDGANDALALKSAAVGFATQGALSVSLSAADVYSRNRSIDSIPLLFELSDLTYKTARRNLVISLFYNLIGGGLAIMGLMNPLVAAFLMPMNATTAFLSTVFGIRLKHDQSHGSLPAS